MLDGVVVALGLRVPLVDWLPLPDALKDGVPDPDCETESDSDGELEKLGVRVALRVPACDVEGDLDRDDVRLGVADALSDGVTLDERVCEADDVELAEGTCVCESERDAELVADARGDVERLGDAEEEPVRVALGVMLSNGGAVSLALYELDADADGEIEELAELVGVHDGVCDGVAGAVSLWDTVPEFLCVEVSDDVEDRVGV